MRVTAGLVVVMLSALVAAGCTDDFEAFSFNGVSDAAALDASSDPSDPSGTGGTMTVDPDAEVTGDGDGVVAGDGDGDSGDADAGAAEARTICTADFTPIVPESKTGCANCGCDMCVPEIVSCTSAGSEAQDALCLAVLECALVSDCTGWDCYCNASNCGASSGTDGDGPCTEAINAATGGQRDTWDVIRAGGDTNEPLVRALNAIFCTLGRHKKSTGGTPDGLCNGECLP